MKINKHLNLSKKLFSKTIDEKAGRDGFGEGLLEAGGKNTDVVVLTADLGNSTKANLFATKFPKRFIQVGVAEQNLMGISTGLGLEGKVPVMTSFGVFSPGNNSSQLRLACYSDANVKVCSAHSGIGDSEDGATHHALEDLALTRSIPNLVVISPADYEETKRAIQAVINYKGPVYIRYYRPTLPVITTTRTPFEIGRSYVLAEGTDITLIAHGPSVYEALKAANTLNSEHGISCEVINCPTIKPLDQETLLTSIKKTKKVVTIEEHHKIGGLGSAVAELTSQKLPTKMTILGIDDTFTESGNYERLKDKYGISEHHIINTVFEMVKMA